MKALVIVQALLCAALAFALYKRHTGANAELEKMGKEQVGMSNKVLEATTLLALSNGTNEVMRSNLVHVAEHRTLEVMGLSNRLVQTRLLLKQTQSEGHEAQLSLQAKAAQLALAEAQRDEFGRQAETASTLQKQLAEATRKMAELATQRDLAVQEAQQLRVERQEMAEKMENLSFLRIQLTKVQDEAELKRRYGQGRTPSAKDRRAQLELQQDETVRVVPASGK